MNVSELVRSYELLADEADAAFADMTGSHGEAMKCRPRCSDCCHAVFGLFLIEAVFVHQQFLALDQEVKKGALLRCSEMERGLRRLERKLQMHEEDPRVHQFILARERIRCPLLDDNEECVLYLHRPITCRVYGIPTRIHGKARVCGKSGFKSGESYPAFDLDGVYRSLHGLSTQLLQIHAEGEPRDPDAASLLISVSKAITTPWEALTRGCLE